MKKNNRQQRRRCVGCGRFVGNSNFGGHNGRPLSGRVWCLRCTAKAVTK